tara:strand:+ start:96750 stop:96854 length:105 start_codon:yes stop_codon:yes gene_type:complete
MCCCALTRSWFLHYTFQPYATVWCVPNNHKGVLM